jgi:hypothetical protein
MPPQEAFQFRKIILGITRLDGVPYFFSAYIKSKGFHYLVGPVKVRERKTS